MQSFRSNGKLLLSGEYFVLDGAKALGIPTKYGQTLTVKNQENTNNQTKEIYYKALLKDDSVWFECKLDLIRLKVLQSTHEEQASNLLNIFKVCLDLNPELNQRLNSLNMTSKLEFPQDWGLGSSSTFINNLANWAEVDAFELSKRTFGGSGYDIACAQNNTSILYQKWNENPIIEPVSFKLKFLNELFFIHLNQKQNSRLGITLYRTKKKNQLLIDEVSVISQQMLKAKTIKEFETLIQKHEKIVSEFLGIPAVKEKLFTDYNGVIKSLGAWGGDFVMVTKRDGFKEYFTKKGFHTILSFNDMFTLNNL